LGGFIPTCYAQTFVEIAKLEKIMNSISRRQFLKIAAGFGLALSMPSIKIESASSHSIDQVWHQANLNPILFDVTEYGTLSISDYPEPKIRKDTYDICSNWSQDHQKLVYAIESCTPLSWKVTDLHRDFIEEKLDSMSDSLYELLGCQIAVNKVLSDVRENIGDSDCPEVVKLWIEEMNQADFSYLVSAIENWLNEEPHWSYECEYFDSCADGQRAALDFFRYIDQNSLDQLGIVIVEGEHPGSTYYAAELRADLKEANEIALNELIPVRFRLV
jgi:hypothetical protein